MSDSLWLYSSWNSPGQNIGVGSHFPLQGIFPTQEWNPGLRHCGQILYQLSYQGSPRILEWVAYPFSSGSSWPRNWTRVSCIAGGFFTNWAIRAALSLNMKWSESESYSVTSDSLRPFATLCDHGILQARILEWLAYPFSRGSSPPRNWTRVFCIAGGFFTSWATREALKMFIYVFI